MAEVFYFYERNVNDNSFEYTLRNRPPLEIVRGSYINGTFKVSYRDIEDSRIDCGIELKKNQGYLKMGHDEERNEFFYMYSEDRVGGGIANIICLNRYGDVETKEIIYTFN